MFIGSSGRLLPADLGNEKRSNQAPKVWRSSTRNIGILWRLSYAHV